MTSKIKVDNIENQCGGAVVTKCGATTTISGSVVKADDIQAADGGNLINQCGTTITLGASGDTINLASGASQSGFGRTGTVDWQTGSIKTATFTAANGEGYFANTSGGAFTMNLPAGTAGNIVSVVDYTNTFQTNALTVSPNGSQKIGGIAAPNTLSTEGQSVTLVYVDDTEGWKNVQDSTSNVTGSPFIIATGGTITCCGNCRIHTFTGPGDFTVSSASTNCASENIVSYLVIGGGGSGGKDGGGGGGAGGYRELKNPITPYTASPLDGYPSAPNRITVTAQAYPITVGGGAAAPTSPGIGVNGTPSVFSTIAGAGGGGGALGGGGGCNGLAGGSGGGGASTPSTPYSGGAGNTPPTSPAQGTGGGNGASGTGNAAGGGGGSGAAGSNGTNPPRTGGVGGAGVTTNISASPVQRGGGGGGGGVEGAPSAGGAGGGGPSGSPSSAATAGTTNTGGGGGGGSSSSPNTGGTGGSGIVIIRYKFQ